MFAALRSRRTYGTTGARLYLDVDARRFQGRSSSRQPQARADDATRNAHGHDRRCLRAGPGKIEIAIEALELAPIERLTVFNGTEAIGEIRGYAPGDLDGASAFCSRRRVSRPQSRTFWRGNLRFIGNRFAQVKPIDHFNADKLHRLAANGPRSISIQ